ncbi:RNA polymerase recycling motor ATPase HelR [Angustibacter sp. Root456]|uniref:RNA polymerase recycling motor ATPase HelR n=1 Tax=Angustibacter sp. Root456 TaxID=1736539 RepID=UPI0006F1F146|nr:RNA polymerase recycling motor ATPase HelR [Angustibacter sp. Root456]KQX61917.1 AAA family ATPase [Angustibacter sp. Root456]
MTDTAFSLPETLAHKAVPALIAADEQHFAAITAALDHATGELTRRLDTQRRQAGGHGQSAMDRDLEVHRLSARLRTLQRYGIDVCLGRIVSDGDPEPRYVGRLGLADADGRRLLVDWRSPAAEPFFAATHAQPMGLLSRRRYRWTLGRVTDYWDEVFTAEGLEGHGALDDQSAFIASLGASRSPRMRDVLATIQADQDAIVRASSRGPLVVDGGPGTGKTVVALHRAAYLLYEDPRLGHHRGGLLFVGPHEPYLAYVSDVLPSLGEEGVRTCTLRDLVPEGATAVAERDTDVAQLKSDARLLAAIEPAVRLYEEVPTDPLTVDVDGVELRLSARDWAEVFAAPDPDTPHNEAREQIWEALIHLLADQHDGDDLSPDALRRSLHRHEGLRTRFNAAWPTLDPLDVVGDLWSVPAYLRHCAPWLEPAAVRTLQRDDPTAWTTSDLPFLDAARRRVGDPDATRRRTRERAAVAAQRQEMDAVVDHLVATDDSEMKVMSMLRVSDLQSVIVDDAPITHQATDALAGPFAHVVVDEAQELTDAEWQMLLSRCPSRSLTIVGDRAQARHGFSESWAERLARLGVASVRLATLSINYRTPEEVMTQAEPVIRAAVPDANVPTSVRRSGLPVQRGRTAHLESLLDRWLDAHAEGTACVIGGPPLASRPRVRSLTPALAKGLEFDLVVLVDPEAFGTGIEGAVDRYVAMTRATQQLVVLTSDD